MYRQEKIFERAGLKLSRSTLADWVGACGVHLQPLVDALRQVMLGHRVIHADETPVQMLKPGSKKTHRAYLWAYAPGAFENLRAVVYDFNEGRAGQYAREFLGDWQGSLVCDDYSSYKACFTQGMTEIGCMAHARRKFFELHANGGSQLAEQALHHIAQLYRIEKQVKDLAPADRLRIRQERARPLAIGRSNWLFAGSLRAGKRAAVIMSLIQSAKLNGHDPYAYLKDVLTRLPTQPASRIAELLPHNWQPQTAM